MHQVCLIVQLYAKVWLPGRFACCFSAVGRLANARKNLYGYFLQSWTGEKGVGGEREWGVFLCLLVFFFFLSLLFDQSAGILCKMFLSALYRSGRVGPASMARWWHEPVRQMQLVPSSRGDEPMVGGIAAELEPVPPQGSKQWLLPAGESPAVGSCQFSVTWNVFLPGYEQENAPASP